MEKRKRLAAPIKWLLNIAIAYDQLWNARLGGDPDETISSRLGKFEKKFPNGIPWRYPIRKFIVWGLDKIDRNHCKDAIEADEGKDAVIKQ